MMKLNRRAFLTTLGGTLAALAAKPVLPVLALVPVTHRPLHPEFQSIPITPSAFNLDEINAFAFLLHAEAFPEHATHYRNRALGILERRRMRQ